MKVPLKFMLKETDIKSVILLFWLNISLFLAAARFIFVRIGLVEGPVREGILFCIASLPLLLLMLELVRVKKAIPQNVKLFLLIFGAIVLVCLFSLLFNSQLQSFYFRKEYGIWRVFRPDGAIYAILMFSMFDDAKQLQNILVKSAYIRFFYLFVVVFIPAKMRGYWLDVAPGGGTMEFSYSLSFGYEMLFPLTVCMIAGLSSHKIIHYVTALVSALLIVTNGGRGALVCILLFVALLIIDKIMENGKFIMKKALIVGTMVLAGVLILYFKDYFLVTFANIMRENDIGARNIEKIVNGTFSNSNGRDVIWNTVITAICEGGPLGYGLMGDRPFVAPLHVAGYSHNLFLELIASFGLIGAAVIVFIVIDAIRMLFFCNNRDWKMIYLILFICSCKLLLSLSLWYAWEFWAAAAVSYKYKNLNLRILPEIVLTCKEKET